MQRPNSEVVVQALESIHREKYGGGGTATQFEDEIVPPLMRRSIAVYEAARCLIGYITPHYDEISKVQLSMHHMMNNGVTKCHSTAHQHESYALIIVIR